MVFSGRDGPGGRGEKDGGKSLASMMFTVTVADDCSGEVPLSEECVCGWVSECMRVGRGWLVPVLVSEVMLCVCGEVFQF